MLELSLFAFFKEVQSGSQYSLEDKLAKLAAVFLIAMAKGLLVCLDLPLEAGDMRISPFTRDKITDVKWQDYANNSTVLNIFVIV